MNVWGLVDSQGLLSDYPDRGHGVTGQGPPVVTYSSAGTSAKSSSSDGEEEKKARVFVPWYDSCVQVAYALYHIHANIQVEITTVVNSSVNQSIKCKVINSVAPKL